MSSPTRVRHLGRRSIAALTILLTTVLAVAPLGAADEPPKVTAPQPTVPEVFTLLGEFVRVAYNNEGYATMGYRLAQEKVGSEWMMLLVGVTMRKPTEGQKIARTAFTVTTPDGTVVPLATQKEYMEGAAETRPLTRHAQMMRDSVNYFPVEADLPCALSYFAEMDSKKRSVAWDETELSYQRACVGRLFFKVPGGIKVGQHWLNIQFANSTIQVPFRILTEDEEKEFEKTWQDIKAQHEAGTLDGE